MIAVIETSGRQYIVEEGKKITLQRVKDRDGDAVVFDPEKIHDRSTYHNPFVHPIGIDAVVVNGKLEIEGGELTGVAAGVVLKKSR